MRNRLCLLVLAALVCALLFVAGCSANKDTSTATDSGAGSTDSSSPEATGDYTAYEEVPLHTSSVKVTGTETAVIQTNKGAITLELYPQDAPNTVASFIELADAGFYNGIKFHRVVPGFVVQGGDPLTRDLTSAQVAQGAPGLGTGGPGWNQKAEFNSRKHVTGTLAMARSRDVDSAGSQFYICLAPQPSLDGQYTVFGQVTEGMDVVNSIQAGDVIESLTIRR